MMSDRERWILYPLLFLALGAALKDKLVPPQRLECAVLVADAVHVKRLGVFDSDNFQRIDMRVEERKLSPDGKQKLTMPQIQLTDARRQRGTVLNQEAVLTPLLNANGVHILDDKGRPRVKMGTKIEEVPQTEGETEDSANKKEQDQTQGFVEILDAEGATKITLDTKHRRATEGAESIEASVGRLQILGFPGQPITTLMPHVATVNNLFARGRATAPEIWTHLVRVQGQANRPVLLLAARPLLDEAGKPTTEATGQIQFLGKDFRPIMKLTTNHDRSEGVVDLQSADGVPRVSILGNDDGGQIAAYNGKRAFQLTLGHNQLHSGIMVKDISGIRPYTRPFRAKDFAPRPAPQPPAPEPTTETDATAESQQDGVASDPEDAESEAGDSDSGSPAESQQEDPAAESEEEAETGDAEPGDTTETAQNEDEAN